MAGQPPKSDKNADREETSGGAHEPRRGSPRGSDSEHRREGRLRDFARRILAERGERPPKERDDEDERDGYVPLEVARDAVFSLLETGDRAKTEMVRMVAREVRHYLDELRLSESLEHVARHYKLEVHASFALEPKEDSEGSKFDVGEVKVEAKPKVEPNASEDEDEA